MITAPHPIRSTGMITAPHPIRSTSCIEESIKMKGWFARWRLRDFEDWHICKDEYTKYKWRQAMKSRKLYKGSGSGIKGTIGMHKKGLNKKMQTLANPGPKCMKKSMCKRKKKSKISCGDDLIGFPDPMKPRIQKRMKSHLEAGLVKGSGTTGIVVQHEDNLLTKSDKLLSLRHMKAPNLSGKDGLIGSKETLKPSTQIQRDASEQTRGNNVVINLAQEIFLSPVKVGTPLDHAPRKYPSRPRVSAVRNFPIGCGRKVNGGDGKELPKMPMLESKGICDAKVFLGVESILDVSSIHTFPIGCGRITNGGDRKELSKLHVLGRGLAVRTFPIGCGRNANGGDRKELRKLPMLGSKSIGDEKTLLGAESIFDGEKAMFEGLESQHVPSLSSKSKSESDTVGSGGVELGPIEVKACSATESQSKSQSETQEKVEIGVELSPTYVKDCSAKSGFIAGILSENKSDGQDGHEKVGIVGAELSPIYWISCSARESQCMIDIFSQSQSEAQEKVGIGLQLSPVDVKVCSAMESRVVTGSPSESKSEDQEKGGIGVELGPTHVKVCSAIESQFDIPSESPIENHEKVGIGVEWNPINVKVCRASEPQFVVGVPLDFQSKSQEKVGIGADFKPIDVKVHSAAKPGVESQFKTDVPSKSKSAVDEKARIEIVAPNVGDDKFLVGVGSEHVVGISLGSKSMDDENAQIECEDLYMDVEKARDRIDVQFFDEKDEKESETRKRKREEEPQIDDKKSMVDCSLHYIENETVCIEQEVRQVPILGSGYLKEVATRKEVKDTLRVFQAIYRKLLHEPESKVHRQGFRADLVAFKLFKEKFKGLGDPKKYLGSVPGVEVGDEFHLRVEMCLVGLHRQNQAGIDYIKQGGRKLATSIVSSGRYADDIGSSGVLEYSGCGVPSRDQKLERGNLALKNSMDAQTPVRVIRGFKGHQDSNSQETWAKKLPTYVYDGLYLVEDYWRKMGKDAHYVFMFRLKRIPGQPELAINEVKRSKKSTVRQGLRAQDISQGEEKISIPVLNTIDDESPMPFKYINKMMFPSKYSPTPPRGCDCIDGCSDSEKCACAVKNGGEVPFNHGGAIVRAKPLVYECGPSCKCPPSCYNRVSQCGIKIPLEIFKTESRGWGVRSLISILSGSFICEYVGELVDDEEAERRVNDEYLFEIGNNFNVESLWEGLSPYIPDLQNRASCEVVDQAGFTIDASACGNVGRFINHSCSPNLFAQNLLYDHDNKSMPHIMLFASENIQPLQELTYDYNYAIDQVHDSDGNIKIKSCHCGSSECSGRLY